MIRTILEHLASYLPYRDITGPDESLYLRKYLLLGRSGGMRIHLHHFLRGDAALELHSHPWRLAVSLILAGGYVEERRVIDAVVGRVLKPWSLNIIRASTFHRVDLLEHDCWTLFVSGPVVQTWGFWDRDTGVLTPWRLFTGRE